MSVLKSNAESPTIDILYSNWRPLYPSGGPNDGTMSSMSYAMTLRIVQRIKR